MAIDPLATWRSSLAALPKVTDASWAANFAGWYADRLVAITTDPTQLVATGFVLTYGEAAFAAALLALAPTTDAAAGIAGFADAWLAGIQTALYPATLTLLPGTFKPPSTPATLFSAVASVVLDPASVAAARAKIIELATAPPVTDANDSEFPVKFREATLLLTITVSGTNSVVPTPAPLVVPNVPLI